MEQYSMYQDIAVRTGGDIYIGVVGPVRTGKSTFIKRFMEKMVIPDIENVYKRERAKDELPQSGSGKTIMTAEPKFVPEEAAELALAGGGQCRVRLVDCVGYLIPGALGSVEGDAPRMVMTTWNEEPVTMEEAAEIGTRKVISEHSTIGLVVTTDGTVTDFDRKDYEKVEERVISELQALGKPFLVLVNTREPNAPETRALTKELSEQYGVTVLAANCAEIDKEEITEILTSVLYEFPLTEIQVELPRWVGTLPAGHKVKTAVYNSLRASAGSIGKMRDIEQLSEAQQVANMEYISEISQGKLDLGKGSARIETKIPMSVFYEIAGEETGLPIRDDADLIPLLTSLAQIKNKYMRFEGALAQVKQTGYGIVMPDMEELSLKEPEIIRQGGKYGVKLSASAPSIHLISANIKTEITPIVGTEKQSEELVHYLLSEFEGEPGQIWKSNIFGKSLSELVNEGLHTKLARMPEDARGKIQETLEKIINEGSGGLICIIL